MLDELGGEANATLYDLSVPLFLHCKQHEAEILDDLPHHNGSQVHLIRTAVQLIAADPERRISQQLISMVKRATDNATDTFHVLKCIDEVARQPVACSPLNRLFRDVAHVTPIRDTAWNILTDEKVALQRTFRDIGSRIENFLDNISLVRLWPGDYRIDWNTDIGTYFHGMSMGADGSGVVIGIAQWRPAGCHCEIVPNGSGSFIVRGWSDAKTTLLQAALTSTVRKAVECRIEILVLPELTMSPELLDHLRQELTRSGKASPLRLVVAGSYHDEQKSGTSGARNVCHVLSGDGQVLGSVYKMSRYHHDDGQDEGISIGERRILVADTPAGRIAVVICLDYINPDVYERLAELRPHLVLVPAMSKNLLRFEHVSRLLGEHNSTVTAVANCPPPLCGAGDVKNLGYVYAPVKGKHLDHGFARLANDNQMLWLNIGQTIKYKQLKL